MTQARRGFAAGVVLALLAISGCTGVGTQKEPTTHPLPVGQRLDRPGEEACQLIFDAWEYFQFNHPVGSPPAWDPGVPRQMRTTAPDLLRKSSTPGAAAIADRLAATDFSTLDPSPDPNTVDRPATEALAFATTWCQEHGFHWKPKGTFHVN